MTDPRYQLERRLRNKILLQPIGVEDFGWEQKDQHSLHFIAELEDKLVGCALLCLEQKIDQNRGQLLQMAVTDQFQSLGIGRLLIEALMTESQKQGLENIFCYARFNVISFYDFFASIPV